MYRGGNRAKKYKMCEWKKKKGKGYLWDVRKEIQSGVAKGACLERKKKGGASERVMD